jgi:hypothetical protein
VGNREVGAERLTLKAESHHKGAKNAKIKRAAQRHEIAASLSAYKV